MVTFGSLRYVLPTFVFDTIFSVIACLFNVFLMQDNAKVPFT